MLTLSHLAYGFEKIVSRLPGPIRKPVEREWNPIRELFLNRRAPRLLVIAEPKQTVAEAELWLRTLFQMAPERFEVGTPPWSSYRHHGALDFTVVEHEAEVESLLAVTEESQTGPDIFLYLSGGEPSPFAKLRGELPAIITGEGLTREAIVSGIARALPLEARLEFSRMSGDPGTQREIAALLTRSTSAICMAVGAQPIPLADFPILTSLQVLMVSGIIHTTGQPWNARMAKNFITALGANLGFGLLLREGARAVCKLLPGWGNAISGAVSAAGTYAVGRAASAYFIDHLPMREAKKQFRFFRRNRLKNRE